MKISTSWLKGKSACIEGIEWFKKQSRTDGIEIVNALMAEKKFKWANWLIVRLMIKMEKVEYAIFAAEKAIHVYEKKYPTDKRPRNAIEATKKYLKYPSRKSAKAAADAYASADAATADASDVAATAAAAAAAYAAVYAVADAAADAAADAYAVADTAAAAYATAAKKKLQKEIIENGIRILNEITKTR